MRKLFGFIIIVLLVYACGNGAKTGGESSTKAISDSAKGPALPDSIVVYDWNKDGIKDTFILHQLSKQSYSAIIMKISGHEPFTDAMEPDGPMYGAVYNNPDNMDSSIRYFDERKSKYIALLRMGAAAKSPVLLYNTYPFDPETQANLLWSLDANGKPAIVLEADCNMFKVRDIDHDGINEIELDSGNVRDLQVNLGGGHGFYFDKTRNDLREQFTELKNSKGGFVKIYTYHHILKMMPDNTFKLDTGLSRKRSMEANYGCWESPVAGHSPVIMQVNNNDIPRLMNATEAMLLWNMIK